MDLPPEEEMFRLLQDTSFPKKLRFTALEYILGFSASPEGLNYLLQHDKYILTIFMFTEEQDKDYNDFCECAYKCLLNISSGSDGTMALLSVKRDFYNWIICGILDRKSDFIQIKCHLLNNVTRYKAASEQLVSFFLASNESLENLMHCFTSNDSELKNKYNHLAFVLGNLTTTTSGRCLFLNTDSPYLKFILSYTSYPDSEIRRLGTAIALKNCCFEIDYHKHLLEDIKILPSLLLPLAGPEDFDDDEMEKFPIDLQYLGETKQRETNAFVRIMLMEALTKLCSTKFGRLYLREKGVYYILRELHKWESDSSAITACENVVDILISDEPDPSMDNLMEISIPQHLVEQFEKITSTTCKLPTIVL